MKAKKTVPQTKKNAPPKMKKGGCMKCGGKVKASKKGK